MAVSMIVGEWENDGGAGAGDTGGGGVFILPAKGGMTGGPRLAMDGHGRKIPRSTLHWEL